VFSMINVPRAAHSDLTVRPKFWGRIAFGERIRRSAESTVCTLKK